MSLTARVPLAEKINCSCDNITANVNRKCGKITINRPAKIILKHDVKCSS